MHPQTYEIKEFPTEDAAKEAGFTVTLTKPQALELQALELQGMNRKERRAWLVKHRKEERRALKLASSTSGSGASG